MKNNSNIRYVIRWLNSLTGKTGFQNSYGTCKTLNDAELFGSANLAEYHIKNNKYKMGRNMCYYISKCFIKKTVGSRITAIRLTKYDKNDFLMKL